ncbi:MAG TPA: UPF0182 family protein [Pilimelia sp.]|nr:UPF0182 family protein [Pilimelia sp.]
MRSSPLPKMSRRGRATVVVLVGVFLLFTVAGWGVDAYTDWLWFGDAEYTQVFTGMLSTRLLLFLSVGLALGVLVGGNLYLAYRLRPLLRPHSPEQATLERYRLLLTPRVGTWIGLAAGLVGLFAGLSAQSRWGDWLLFRNAQPFNTPDAEFGVDVGFYVFEYPFYRYLLGIGFTATVLALLGALAVHYIYGGVRLQGVGDRITGAARAHLTTLVAVFVLLKAVAYVLDRRALLLGYNEGTKLYGAGYTDINALLPAKEILAYISVLVAIAIIVFSNAVLRNLLWPGMALALLGISAVAIGGIYPWAVQTFTVKPSLRDKEAPYIARSIAATRAAYGLTDTAIRPYAAGTVVPPRSLADPNPVVDNIRLLDPELVSETFTQLQQVRGFYDFGRKLDIDRYTVDGRTRDYVIGMREVSDDELTDQQRGWQNRHTVFTHGYGAVAAPANRVCNGLPYFVSGFLGEQPESDGETCASSTEQIPASQPRIYFGERLTNYAIVGQSDAGRNVEFDRPTSEGGEQYYTYTGDGGVEIGSMFRRLLYAMRFAESNFVLSDAVNDSSKLLYVRDPRERVKKVAPFLTLDGDPYPAVVDGRIQWIIDGYTTAATYPYAERVNLQSETTDAQTNLGTFAQAKENVNYIRNSVKATVDAYHGTVKLYEFDETDPVLKAWNQAFGGDLVIPRAEIPANLAAHFRYPADLFKVQRNLLARFHVTDPVEFFSGQNFWEVPNAPDNPDAELKQPPYYLLTQLPGQDEARFQLTSALTPNGRQNLAAIVSGSYVDNRPRLEVLKLPNETRVAGPVQIHQQMTNNADIRTQLSFLSADNKAQVLFGNLLSLPFGDGILYVEPVYVKSSNQEDAYPLLQRVLLSFGEGKHVVLADSLDEGIDQLIKAGGQTPPRGDNDRPPPGGNNNTPPPSGALAAAGEKVQAAINEVRAAQSAGDFERYGRALAALDQAMKEFEAARRAAGATPTGTPSPTGSPNPSPTASPGGSPSPSPG